jgi:hypothetical protein
LAQSKVLITVESAATLTATSLDIHFIDGQALDPSRYFGEFDDNGVWQPIDMLAALAPTGSTCPSAITAPPPH